MQGVLLEVFFATKEKFDVKSMAQRKEVGLFEFSNLVSAVT